MPSFLTRAHTAFKLATGIFSDSRFQQAASTLTQLAPKNTPPRRGTPEFLSAYSSMPWLHGVINRIASSTSSVDWQLFAQRKSVNGVPKFVRNRVLQRAPMKPRAQLKAAMRKAGELVEVQENQFLNVLQAPNPLHTSMSIRGLMQIYLDLVGESFLIKERGPMNRIERLWPIPPHWITELPTGDRPSYEMRVNGVQSQVPDSEMFYMSHPDPLNPYGRGVGVAQALTDELETDEFASRHTKQFFWNSARPDLLIFPKGINETGAKIKWTPAEMNRLEVNWRSKVQGYLKSWAPYFVPQELGIHEMNQNFKNLQMNQLREFERNIILQVIGVPPEIMGVIENSNRATIDAAFYLFCLLALLPRLEFQRGSMQERLIPEFDERLIIDYDSPMDDDKEFQLKVATIAPWMLTQDEWRRMGGHDEAESGGELRSVRSGESFTDDLEGMMAERKEQAETIANSMNQPANQPNTEDDEEKSVMKFIESLELDGLNDHELFTIDRLLKNPRKPTHASTQPVIPAHS